MPGKMPGSPSAGYFPAAFYVLDEYIPFRMPRWRGSHEIRNFWNKAYANPPFCRRERFYLEKLLIWWDDHRDLRIKRG